MEKTFSSPPYQSDKSGNQIKYFSLATSISYDFQEKHMKCCLFQTSESVNLSYIFSYENEEVECAVTKSRVQVLSPFCVTEENVRIISIHVTSL